MSGVVIEPKSSTCFHCDFGSGQRGMDTCGRCDGTGSVFRVKGQAFPNTKQGYLDAVYALNDPELAREQGKHGNQLETQNVD